MKSKIILRILLAISLVVILGHFIYVIGDYNKQVTEYGAAYPFISITIVFNCLFFIWTFAKKSKPNAFMYTILGIFLVLNLIIPAYRITTLTVDGAHTSVSEKDAVTTSKNMYGLNSLIK